MNGNGYKTNYFEHLWYYMFQICPIWKTVTHEYAIPKIKMLCNLHCLKARLRLPYNKYQRRSRLNLISQQLGVSVEYLFGKDDDILAKL